MKAGPTEFTAIDLFAGAGGLSLGFQRAGFRIIHAVEHDPRAVETYRRNVGDHITQAEITEDSRAPRASLILGGPPCQGFSSAGQRRPGDHRNTLVSVFAALVARSRPDAFLFENVEGFLTAEGGKRVFDLLRPLIEVGYRIHLRKVNTANFGVPQHRKRVICVGGLGWDPSFPEFTHAAFGAPGAHLAGRTRPRAPSFKDALRGLPRPARSSPGEPSAHYHERLDDDDLERIAVLKPGQTMRDLPERLWHESYRKRAYRRVMDGTPTEERGGAPAGIRRLRSDEPCKAITSGARREFIHPVEDRYLTIRECARIQTFPDSFVFAGNAADQMLLIGNAVPPLFAEVLGRSLRRDFEKLTRSKRPKGALLSFVPTLSSGMSPALRAVATRVLSTFHVEHAQSERLVFAWD